MSCCGNARQRLGPMPGPATTEAQPPATPARRFTIWFEYTGERAATVIGAATGRRYRFDRPGAQVAIDPRDRIGLSKCPKLRQLG